MSTKPVRPRDRFSSNSLLMKNFKVLEVSSSDLIEKPIWFQEDLNSSLEEVDVFSELY